MLDLLAIVLQPAQPDDLTTFLWVAVVTLCSVIAALFWLLQKANAAAKEDANAHKAELAKIIELYHAGMNANTSGMKEVTRAMTDMASVGRLQEYMERLEGRIEKSYGPKN